MSREHVPFDDLHAGDWITVRYFDRMGRLRMSSGAFREFFCDGKFWYLKKTGRIWAIATQSIAGVDVRRVNEEARR